MKRLHVHVNVADLERSIAFYSDLFDSAPGVRKADYAKWLLDDPPVNFAISRRGRARGLDHLGIQVESRAELEEISGRLVAAGRQQLTQEGAACCYAVSDKAWTSDPNGLAWETFHSTGEVAHYGGDTFEKSDLPRLISEEDEEPAPAGGACCSRVPSE